MNALLLRGTFPKDFRDVKIDEICVVKNDRLDRALDLVALVAVGRDDVHHFAGNAVLVSERDAAEGMTELLPEFALDHFAGPVLVELERLCPRRPEANRR